MVQEKIVIILIIIAIILSAVSVILTIAQMNMKNIPQIQISSEPTSSQAAVGIYIIPNPLAGPGNISNISK
ncbi:hypothetical protein FJZ19_04295 [Candidatus Pacearchaeota archaeon]|nr:hypothetical protein [Candidatus Pacearchaeota archaeon]